MDNLTVEYNMKLCINWYDSQWAPKGSVYMPEGLHHSREFNT